MMLNTYHILTDASDDSLIKVIKMMLNTYHVLTDASDDNLIGEINSVKNKILRDILTDYLYFFSENKYDVGKTNIEPQQNFR